jgi:hypothetical protein
VGVAGESVSSVGVVGKSSSNDGVDGTSSSGRGVEGDSTSGDALDGFSSTGTGLYAESDGSAYSGAFVVGSNIGTYTLSANIPLEAADNQGDNVFEVDAAGDVTYAGSLNSVSSAARGTKVRAFGPKSTTPTVEDSGSAELVAGAAAVRLDPTFASSIDPHVAYRVFLTPDGDTRGLYVATKAPGGFIVRETQGGRSTLAFDYRIIATSLGSVGQRMSVATDAMLPRADKEMLAKVRTRHRLASGAQQASRAGSQQMPLKLP